MPKPVAAMPAAMPPRKPERAKRVVTS